MSNPTVSFRISDYHLARGLRAIRTLDPTWQLTTPADLIRTIFNDYIAKSEYFNNIQYNINPYNIDPELLQEISYARANLNQNHQLAPLPQIKQKLFTLKD